MGFGRLSLLTVAVTATIALAPGSAIATGDRFEPDTGTQGTEHFNLSSVGSFVLRINGGAYITCNQMVGEGTITNFSVPEGSIFPKIGAIESLDYLHNGNVKCPATGSPFSSCNPTVAGFPINLNIKESTNEMLISNFEVALACETFVGLMNCHYTSSVLDGSFTPPINEVAVFGSAAGDDVMVGEASNSFLCAVSFQFQGSLQLRGEALAQEMELDEM
jgi:hypothetical protein